MATSERIVDVEGSEKLEFLWGNGRYRGWYLTKTKQSNYDLSLDFGGNAVTYKTSIYDYNFKFIMPPHVSFDSGLISYTKGERLLGVFRFPRDEDGRFYNPFQRRQVDIMKLTEEEIRELLGKKSVVTFEAYRIPQYGFQFLSLEESDFEKISNITSSGFSSTFRKDCDHFLTDKNEVVRGKIEACPNYLLILEKVLNRCWEDMSEIALMTDNIITNRI